MYNNQSTVTSELCSKHPSENESLDKNYDMLNFTTIKYNITNLNNKWKSTKKYKITSNSFAKITKQKNVEHQFHIICRPTYYNVKIETNR